MTAVSCDTTHRRSAVLVNGHPGAGKSTLAAALAPELGLPMLSKDTVKETLFDWLGIGDRPWSMRVGAASAEVVWAVLACSPAGGIVEMPMPPAIRDLVSRQLRTAGVDAHCEIWCDVQPAEAFRRFVDRAPGRHPGHLSEAAIAAGLQPPRAADDRPLGLGPVLRVRTDRPVDIAAVATWVRRELDLGTSAGRC